MAERLNSVLLSLNYVMKHIHFHWHIIQNDADAIFLPIILHPL